MYSRFSCSAPQMHISAYYIGFLFIMQYVNFFARLKSNNTSYCYFAQGKRIINGQSRDARRKERESVHQNPPSQALE